MGLFDFFKMKEQTHKTTDMSNKKVTEIYNRTNAKNRDQIFYGGLASAQEILLRLSTAAFNSTEDIYIETSFQIYLQTWIRSRGGFNPQFSTPSYIKKALTQRFSTIPSPTVIACVDQSLDIIYSHEPQLKQKAQMVEDFANYVRTNAEKNAAVQDINLKDEEYGLVSDKPIFVNGFGDDKEYLSHLRTENGIKLTFHRIGSLEVDGISGAVDSYQLLLPDQSVYMTIYICNYGTRTLSAVPKGLIFDIPEK